MLDIYKNIGNTLSALQGSLRIAISNANNFNSPGYKYSFASFTTVFNNVVNPGTVVNEGFMTNPVSYGASMTIGAATTDYAQGNIGFGTNMDMAISGEGFFILSHSAVDTDSNAPKVYTRNGRFQVDLANRFVTDSFGRKVFGYKVNEAGEITDRTLVPIETGGNTDIGFTDGGLLVGNFQARADALEAGDENPPSHIPLYRVALTSFQNKQGLVIVDGGALQATLAAGEPFEPGAGGEGVYGDILGSSLESSNIEVARVALDMALLNRGFSAIQGVIDDVNKIVNNLIGKLAG